MLKSLFVVFLIVGITTTLTSFQAKKPTIKVCSFKKEYDTSSRWWKDSKVDCEKWTLTADKIAYLLLNMKQMDGPTLHDLYNTWPCSYVGTVLVNGNEMQFELNAGSWAYLKPKGKGWVLYGYFKKDAKKYFVEGQAPLSEE
ncbi:hypothetical protein LX64_01068 [Chitinophaga skermanii]|uniref:Uncharacterized protein n=1 Tax=Chitinophaga skermanii TaxID=331697 RepID=A0A327R3G2_9BACT|nr:hypothetical protein [Chitinophaga skermanii]RAJ08417.1 hypothetical protein LX64_01068 [Chitinophaga skermanii]